MNRFYIGQKIVCINHAHRKGINEPVIGETYTIRSFPYVDAFPDHLFFLLVEIKNRICPGDNKEYCFYEKGFVPLDSVLFSESLIKELETEINEENLILK